MGICNAVVIVVLLVVQIAYKSSNKWLLMLTLLHSLVFHLPFRLQSLAKRAKVTEDDDASSAALTAEVDGPTPVTDNAETNGAEPEAPVAGKCLPFSLFICMFVCLFINCLPSVKSRVTQCDCLNYRCAAKASDRWDSPPVSAQRSAVVEGAL